MSAEFGSRIQALVEGSGLERRKAALLLHSLSEADRAWMLTRLGPSQRAALQPLLAELRSLRVPGQPELVRTQILERSREVGRQSLTSIAASRVRQLLACEPAGFVAQALKVGPSSWSDDFQLRVVGKGVDDPHEPLPCGRAAAIEEVLARRLRSVPGDDGGRPAAPSPQRPVTWFTRLLQLMRRSA